MLLSLIEYKTEPVCFTESSGLSGTSRAVCDKSMSTFQVKGEHVKRILILVVLAAGSGFANSPEDAFNGVLDALYSGDAQGLYSSLSTESVAMLNMMLLMVKAQPEEAAAEISDELGIEITGDELSEWTAMDLVSTVLSAPGFIDEFPPREEITVSNCSESGDSCVVYFTVGEVPETFQLLMVKQNGNWKLDQSVIQAEL